MSHEMREFICTSCPVGCPLQLEIVGDEIVEILGNQCQRGAKYAQQELKDPRRMVSTTIAVLEGKIPRVPVRTNIPIPRGKVQELVDFVHQKPLKAPLSCGQVIYENPLGLEGVRVLIARDVEK